MNAVLRVTDKVKGDTPPPIKFQFRFQFQLTNSAIIMLSYKSLTIEV